ncbi:MAG: cell division protein SepF [Defluviitaleaceae bacterium]|nr:cell division protein SepF [Defluviitaleaceae bacterium]
MIGFFKRLGDRLSSNMLAPGAEETDGYYEEYEDGYYEDDYDHEGYYEPEQVQVRYSSHNQSARKSNLRSTASSSRSSSRSTETRNNVYGLPGAVNVQKQTESVIMHPKNMEDAVEIGSHVRSGRMCIVDLTGVPTPEAQRIADYLCGNSDALDGAITRVNNTIIAVSPPNHRVMPDYRDESHFDSGFLKKAANDR